MNSEVDEYQQQLVEVRAALKLEDSGELRELENELLSLIDELRKKVPSVTVGSNVTVETQSEKPLNPQQSVNCESAERVATLEGGSKTASEVAQSVPTKSSPAGLKTKQKHIVGTGNPSPAHKALEEPGSDEFEESKTRWKSFTKHKASKGTMVPAANGIRKKPIPKRPHFANKRS